MKRNIGLSIFCVIMIAPILACGGLLPQPSPTSPPPTPFVIPGATATPRPTPTSIPLPPTPTDLPPQDDEFVSPEGGYATILPPGWEAIDVAGISFFTNDIATLDAMAEDEFEIPVGAAFALVVPMTTEEWDDEFGDDPFEELTAEDALASIDLAEGIRVIGAPESVPIDGALAFGIEVAMTDEPTFGTNNAYMMLLERTDGLGGLVVLGLASPQDWPYFREDMIVISHNIRLLSPGDAEQ